MNNFRQYLWLLTLLGGLQAWPVAAREVPAIGVVLATTGEVRLERQGQQLPASRKAGVQEQDTVVTGDNARARLRFDDGTITTLGANTRLTIRAYQWASKEKPAVALFSLDQGAFRTQTGQLLERDEARFEVSTALGVIGVRGTDFWGGFLDPGLIDVLLVEGCHAVEVSNAGGSVLLSNAGEGTTLKPGQPAPVVKTWPAAKVERAVATITWPEGTDPGDNN